MPDRYEELSEAITDYLIADITEEQGTVNLENTLWKVLSLLPPEKVAVLAKAIRQAQYERGEIDAEDV